MKLLKLGDTVETKPRIVESKAYIDLKADSVTVRVEGLKCKSNEERNDWGLISVFTVLEQWAQQGLDTNKPLEEIVDGIRARLNIKDGRRGTVAEELIE
jgi:hypothetical protein